MKVLYEKLLVEDDSNEKVVGPTASTDESHEYTEDELEEYRRRVEESLFEVHTQHDKHVLTIVSAALALSVSFVGMVKEPASLQMPILLIVVWCTWLACIAFVLLSFISSQLSHRYILKHIENGTYKYEHCNNRWNDVTQFSNIVGFILLLGGGVLFLIVAAHNLPVKIPTN